MGPGLPRFFGVNSRWYLRFTSARWELINCGGLQNNAGPQQAGRAHKDHAQSGDDTVARPKGRCSGLRAIEDQKLMFDEQRLGDDGPDATRPKQAGNRDDQVDEKYGEITHYRIIVIKISCVTSLGNLSDLCDA